VNKEVLEEDDRKLDWEKELKNLEKK